MMQLTREGDPGLPLRSASVVPLDPDSLRWRLPQTLVTGLGVAAATAGSALVAPRHERIAVHAPEMIAAPVPVAPVGPAGEVPA